MNARMRWLLPLATVVLAVAGAGTVGSAIALSATSGAPSAPPSPETSTPVPSAGTATPAPSGSPSASRTVVAVADRADPAWVQRMAETSGIPERALAAYAGATLAIADTHPSCGLGWNTLAGIGHVESEHASIGGSRIRRDGVVYPPIIGIPLDGNGVEAIADTDGGVLDGDTGWDRAVGPMQFIPQTWGAYGQDGNGDGSRDIHQIDDAALAAAAYLCDVGGDLTAPDRWIAAVSAYNPSVEYNNRVAEAANHYATLR